MEEEITLDLRDLFIMLKKRVKLIVAITVACTLFSAILSFFIIKPTFESRTSIIVGKPQETESKLNNNDVAMYQKLIKTYAVIAKSERVAQNASVKLGIKYTPKEIQGMINVTPQQDTQVLEIKAENKDAKEAAAIIDAVTSAFVEESKASFPTGGTIEVLDRAKVPEKPIKPKKAINVAIAFFLGLMVSVGLAFVLEYMDKTIKTEEDVERYLGLPVIGIIPKQVEETQKKHSAVSMSRVISKQAEG
ncbi:capsular polysaccharide biosynthesis protein [Clostridium pascui]|uniref:YveK family protein n=1 Tax=Clostridium pascui TaxID=46609 RepID=UPI00195A3DC5|nr:Wzz/FepE/Etk N-terminal domain-containing protein [Clostridium pascui]MBM7869830.1 capsular polysaccharide biosynthesis protein [Clostridium pascui]